MLIRRLIPTIVALDLSKLVQIFFDPRKIFGISKEDSTGFSMAIIRSFLPGGRRAIKCKFRPAIFLPSPARNRSEEE